MRRISKQPQRYIPFANGRHSTAPGLRPLGKDLDDPNNHVFQLDSEYPRYIENKKGHVDQRSEDYFIAQNFSAETAIEACRFILNRLLIEHQDCFSVTGAGDSRRFENLITGDQLEIGRWDRYSGIRCRSLFDALCMQLQEDVAIIQLDGADDYLAALHVHAPNYWVPAEKVGMNFAMIHDPVPDMEKVKRHYHRLIGNIVQNDGLYERFGWGIADNNVLDQMVHREGTAGHASPRVEGEDYNRYIRIERQVLAGLGGVNALLFTIRTYFQPINELTNSETKALKSALDSMSDNMLKYKGIGKNIDKMRKKLS